MPPRTAPARPHKRNGFWHLVRRVPRAFTALDRRGVVILSTGIRITDDPRGYAARSVVAKLDAGLTRYWNDLRLGIDSGPRLRYEEAVRTARELGLDYAPAENVAALPTRQLLERVELLEETRQVRDKPAVVAVLGGEPPPEVMVSEMPATFQQAVAASLARKSPRQLKKWRTQRDTAVSVFLQVLGSDRPIATLAREHVLLLRTHWQNRILGDEVEIDTANKSIGRVGAMYRTISEINMLNLPPIFEKATIRGAKHEQRIPYDPDFVQRHILADGMFDDVNPEARRVLYLVTETGLRLSEACNLNSKTIILDHPVPHVRVRPDGREMKSDQSLRDIPLVGAALMAMRLQPEGFPRYVDKADHLSALLNKVLEARKLRPNGESVYSLRHTFKDRLRAVGAEDELKDYFMGHAREQPAYGFGYSLEAKLGWLERIAFRPPASV
jgi:integrase